MAQRKVTDEEIFSRIDGAFDGLDAGRAQGLERLKLLQQARDAAAAREQERLTAKYGADHPRVVKLKERRVYNQGAFRELDQEIERTSIQLPSLDPGAWMVHGRVLDAEEQGLEGLTLFLADEKGTWVQELGHACTDARGYFALRYTPDAEKGSAVPEDQPLTLTVVNAESQVLHREDEPAFVVPGAIEVRLIVLDQTELPCRPPRPGDDGGDGGDDVASPDGWLARGQVLTADQTPAAGLIVSLYDKDLLFDDVLGTAETDDQGRFRILYRTEAFRDLFESNPDLYLKVLDREGNVLHRTRKPARPEAGRVEEFTITLKAAARKTKGR